ncbi:MAG: hypothetical protein HY814_09905 [Candidatus Riflebacteria bacterium]|nr:hypothetical protein [Candidatus Riflebacteria bacterium]
MADPDRVRSFFLRFLSARGFSAVEVENGVYSVSGPPQGPPLLPGRPSFELTFDPEAAAESASRELITAGSPLLEHAVNETLSAGQVLHQHALRRTVEHGLVEERVRQRVTLDRLRYSRLGPGRLVEARVFHIHFILTLHGDVTQQFLVPVFVDGTSGRALAHFYTDYQRLTLSETRQFVLPRDALAAADAIGLESVLELHRIAGPRLQGLLAELSTQKRDEERRIRQYFEQLEEDERGRASRAKTAELKQKHESALAAIRAERSMRLRDLETRYQPKVEARIGAVEVLHVPVWTGQLEVERGTDRFLVPLRYDPSLGAVLPLACPGCGRSTLTLIGLRDLARPGCPACVPQKAPVPALREAAPQAPPRVEEPRARREAPAPSGPVTPPSTRRERRPLLQEPPAMQPSPVGIVGHWRLWLVRIANHATAATFHRTLTLGERLGREVSRTVDRALGGTKLEFHKAPGPKDKRVWGCGMVTAAIDLSVGPRALIAGTGKWLQKEAQDAFLHSKGRSGSRVVQVGLPEDHPEAPGRLVGLDPPHFLRATVTFCLGEFDRVSRVGVSPPSLDEALEAVLRRELGLTAAGDAVKLLGTTREVDSLLAGSGVVEKYLRNASPKELADLGGLCFKLRVAFSKAARG